MKTLFSATLALFLSLMLTGQNLVNTVNLDNCVINAVYTDGQNIFAAGQISIPGSLKLKDGYIARLDKKGNILWQNYFGGNLIDEIRSITVKDKKIYATGITWTKDKRSQAWLVILDMNGQIIAEHNFGGSKDDAAYKILPGPHGNFYLLGYTTPQNTSYRNLWIAKIDTHGNIIWQKQMGNLNEVEEAYSGQITPDGLIILGRYWNLGVSDINPWIIKMNFDGNLIWERKIPLYEDNYFSVALPDSGNLLLIGNTWEKLRSKKGDIWLMTIDNKGNTVTDKIQGTNAQEQVKSAITHNNSLWIFGGYGPNAMAGIWHLSQDLTLLTQKTFDLPQINDAIILDDKTVVIGGGRQRDGYVAFVKL